MKNQSYLELKYEELSIIRSSKSRLLKNRTLGPMEYGSGFLHKNILFFISKTLNI